MKASKEDLKMTAYQRSGVILVTVILASLQKIKLQNYRLFSLYDEAEKQNRHDSNGTHLLNSTGLMFEDEDIAKFLLRCLLIHNCLAVISCVYLTSWSDKHGRKILLILPYVGALISDIFMLVVLFVPTLTSRTLLVSEGFDGFLGGSTLMSLGCLCYITDSTDHRQRTFYIAIFFGLLNVTPVLDLVLQYYWTPLETALNSRVLILGAVLYRMVCSVCFLIYIKLCVSESVFLLGSFQGNPWTNLLTPINVSDTINCVFKRRLDNMRFYIIILTHIFILYNICLNGNIIAFPEYFKNAFLWSYKDVITFAGLFTVCQTFALWFVTCAASRWHTLDSDLGTYGCITLGISCLILTFSKQGHMAAVGSMYAGIGVLILMSQLIANVSYTALEDVCREAGIPQIIFLLSFGLIAFCLLFFIFLKKNISPHLLGHLNGSESLALINRKGQIEQVFG